MSQNLSSGQSDSIQFRSADPPPRAGMVWFDGTNCYYYDLLLQKKQLSGSGGGGPWNSSSLNPWPSQAETDRVLASFQATPKTHTHVKADVTDFSHTHPFTDVTGTLAASQHPDLSATQTAQHHWNSVSSKPATFPPSTHTHVKADVTDFAHTHVKADVTDFAHTHPASDIASGRLTAARMLDGTSGQFLKAAGAGLDPTYAALVAADIPSLDTSKTTSGRFTAARLLDGISGQFLKAAGAGLDPAYAALVAADIPNLDTAKITSGRFTAARLLDGTSGQFLKAAGAGLDPAYAALVAADIPNLDVAKTTTGTFAEARGGTNQSTYTLGDILYASAANTLAKLLGNITATRKFLRQTGTGTVSAAPVWDTLLKADTTDFAHAILSTSHSDALAGTVLRGDLIAGNATPAWARLAKGAARTYLKSDGTDVVFKLFETAESGSTPVTDAASTVIGAGIRVYSFFTLPTTEDLYVITGIEWKNGATVAGNTTGGVEIVNANPPTLAAVILSAISAELANAGASSIQRQSRVASEPIRGGSICGVFVYTASTTHTYRTATVASANNRKTVTYTASLPTQDVTAWTASTVQAYVKAYFRGYGG